ncbi:MAG TPA: hypothetical protein PLY11_12215, partial [Syntrophorhabdus sp.]|nr:hypothetical protein [Syntrophorhabdus sp.]
RQDEDGQALAFFCSLGDSGAAGSDHVGMYTTSTSPVIGRSGRTPRLCGRPPGGAKGISLIGKFAGVEISVILSTSFG